MITVGGVTIPAERSNRDNFCVPCISYRKNASMVEKKNTFFRHNCGSSANRNKFVDKLHT